MADDESREREILEELERRALFDLPEEDPAEIDIVRELTDESGEKEPVADMTLGGYIEKHNRVPAFEGADGQPYTVDIEVEEDAGGSSFAAFFIFVRWAATGAGIMDHVESGDIASRATAESARQAAMELSLYEIKAELDAAIERKRKNLEE